MTSRDLGTSRSLPIAPGRDSWILLLVALLLPIVLATFTLVAFRNAVDLGLEARRREAAMISESVASQIRDTRSTSTVDLAALAPSAWRAVVADRTGRVRASTGEPLPGPVLAPLGGVPPDITIVVDDDLAPIVAAFTPVEAGGSRSVVRVDLDLGFLASQRRSLAILTGVVLGTDLAAVIWLMLFLRRILSPYDTILARARELRRNGPNPEQDEATFLLSTFEQALAGTPPQSELAVLEETLGASLESGLLLLDRNGDALLLNPIGSEILGVPSPTSAEPLATLLASQPPLRRCLQAAVADRLSLQREEITVHVAGEDRALGLATTPLRRSDGELLGFLVLFTDVTSFRQQALEQHLAESLAQLGELSAGVAHELRNSLGTIRGHLTLLRRAVDSAGRTDHLDELDAETRHLGRVVADFLAFARPERAQVEPVDVDALVRHAVADPTLGHVELHLPERWSTMPPTVSGDRHLLERGLRNLLRNARDAQADTAAPHEAIELLGESSGRGVLLRVLDRGPGVSSVILDRPFRPFVTTRPQGVGLGLALTYRIVSLHGGRLELGKREGGGTAADVWLPIAGGESKEPRKRDRPTRTEERRDEPHPPGGRNASTPEAETGTHLPAEGNEETDATAIDGSKPPDGRKRQHVDKKDVRPG